MHLIFGCPTGRFHFIVHTFLRKGENNSAYLPLPEGLLERMRIEDTVAVLDLGVQYGEGVRVRGEQ